MRQIWIYLAFLYILNNTSCIYDLTHMEVESSSCLVSYAMLFKSHSFPQKGTTVVKHTSLYSFQLISKFNSHDDYKLCHVFMRSI